MSIPSWAVKGAKVVCVDAEPLDNHTWHPSEAPKAGAVYTVARAFIHNGDAIVHLAELARELVSRKLWGPECGYAIERFRPLILRSQEQDMELFHPLLKVDQRARERA